MADKKAPPLSLASDLAGGPVDTAPEAAPVERPGDAQPAEFPSDYDEWASGKAAPYRLLLAGYRARLRVRGGLLRKQKPTEWDADFKTFCEAPPETKKPTS